MKTITLRIPDDLYLCLARSFRSQGYSHTHTKTLIQNCLSDYLYQSIDTDDSEKLLGWINSVHSKLGRVYNTTMRKECRAENK